MQLDSPNCKKKRGPAAQKLSENSITQADPEFCHGYPAGYQAAFSRDVVFGRATLESECGYDTFS